MCITRCMVGSLILCLCLLHPCQTTVNDRQQYREAPTHCSPNHSLVTQSPALPAVSTALLNTKDSLSDSCSPLEPNNASHSLPLSASNIATDISSIPDKSKSIASKLNDFQSFVYTSQLKVICIQKHGCLN